MRTLHRATAIAGTALVGSFMLSIPATAQGDLDCADFPSQAAAQAHYAANPSDPDRLDADSDGVACESFTGYTDPTRAETPIGGQVATPPQGGVATGGGSTAGIEYGGVLAAGGLALTVGLGGLSLAAARRSRS